MSYYSEQRLYSMENSRLREIYKTIKTTRNRFSKFAVFISIPAVLFFLLMGWQFLLSLKNDMINMLFDCSITGTLDFVLFALCGILITSEENKFIACVPLIFALLVGLKYLLFKTFSGICVLMFVYFVIACIMIYRDNKILYVMKKMNTFPFLKKDDGKIPHKDHTNDDINEVLKKFN